LFDCSELEKAHPDAFSDGLLAKSGALFSMSAYEKSTQASMLGMFSPNPHPGD
jgi:hypothetical protein